MKLLRERVEDVEVLKENTQGGPKYYIQGIMLQGNIKNRNGRIYPTHVLEKAVAEYTDTYIKNKRSLGELAHPDTPSINHERASHIIEKLWQDGNNFIGRARILTELPMGKIVRGLMDEGVTLGVSSRGLGSLREQNGSKIVQNDFFLTTAADIVSDPSAPDAFVENMMESVNWIMESGKWVPQWQDQVAIPAVEKATRASREEREAVYLQLFEEFITRI